MGIIFQPYCSQQNLREHAALLRYKVQNGHNNISQYRQKKV